MFMKVFYECIISSHWRPDYQSRINVELEESANGGTNWSTISGTREVVATYAPGSESDNFLLNFKYILNKWQGTKLLRLRASAWSSSTEMMFGRQYAIDPSTNSGRWIYSKPQVFAYQI